MSPNRIAKGFSDRFPKHFPSHFPLVKPTDSPAPKLTPLIEPMLLFQDAQRHSFSRKKIQMALKVTCFTLHLQNLTFILKPFI